MIRMKCPHCGRKESMQDKSGYYRCLYCGKKIDYNRNAIVEPTAYEQRVMICPTCGFIALSDGYDPENPQMKCQKCNNDMINTKMTGYIYGEACVSCRQKEIDQKLRESFVTNNSKFNSEKYNENIQDEKEKELNRMIETGKTIEQERAEYDQRQQEIALNRNKLHCPTCGSTNIRKIPTSKRVTGGILFGLFSGNIGKTFECLDCKYKW